MIRPREADRSARLAAGGELQKLARQGSRQPSQLMGNTFNERERVPASSTRNKTRSGTHRAESFGRRRRSRPGRVARRSVAASEGDQRRNHCGSAARRGERISGAMLLEAPGEGFSNSALAGVGKMPVLRRSVSSAGGRCDAEVCRPPPLRSISEIELPEEIRPLLVHVLGMAWQGDILRSIAHAVDATGS